MEQNTEMQTSVVELRHVTRLYKPSNKNTTLAIKDVSLRIECGEMVAITGPSGSGKSTLLQLIGGLDRPTSGEVIVDGQEVQRLRGKNLAAYRSNTVGFIFQSFYLQQFLTINRNVEIPLMFARVKRALRSDRIKTVIEAVGLSDRSSYLPKELSGGQVQRAAIARALVNKPQIILADEPTGNLDSVNSAMIMKFLTDLRKTQNTTVIIVTHDATIAHMADRIIRIADGEVVA